MALRDRYLFEKVLVSSGTFPSVPDLTFNILESESLIFINEGAGAIEISFDGETVHNELNPSSGVNSVIVNYSSFNKIWFRLKSGAASVVRIQNDAQIGASTTVNLSGVTVGGTASNFGDPFPVPGTAVGFDDGTNMQGARVYDVDTGAATEYVLGTVLRASESGGSVETGTPTHPLHVQIQGSNTDYLHPLQLDGYGAIDGFGRLRVSTPITILDTKQIFDDQPLIWDTQTVTGGTSAHQTNRASSLLTVTSTVGSKVIRQTKTRAQYQPGKSLLIFSTFVMGTGVAGIDKKAGYFDANNGVYFKNNGSTNSLVIRSKVSGVVLENEVTQANWNIDTLNGLGPSGINLDITKAQIFVVDLEWLGVGTVRCGFVINGAYYYIHKFNHSNILNSVYMSSPNLPVRYEIENVSSGTGSTLEQICASVASEGGYEITGNPRSIDRGVSPFTTIDKNQLYPVLSLRINSTRAGVAIQPNYIDVLCTSSNAIFKWALILNPTINGADAASWQSINGSYVQYDVSRTLTNYCTGGYVLASGYGSQKVTTTSNLIQGRFPLGISIAGVPD